MKSIVSEKGQIKIPKSVGTALGLRPGTVIEITAQSGELVGRKVNAEDVFVKWRGRVPLLTGLSVGACRECARAETALTAKSRATLVQRALSIRSTKPFKGKFVRSEAYDE